VPICGHDGVPGNWHLAHLGQFALSGPGTIIVEATGVEPEGRITPGCTGLYDDACEEAFANIITFMKSVGDVPRSAFSSAMPGARAAPWHPGKAAGFIEGEGAWVTDAPSACPIFPAGRNHAPWIDAALGAGARCLR
jgi:2,4-dienoyl-CoA reductase-like NADH-dependent reductase (Old Yellow Enzyme family)